MLSLCWGREGVNVTRFKRGEATRLQSSVDMLGMSLSAVYTLLTFRVCCSTICHVFVLLFILFSSRGPPDAIMLLLTFSSDLITSA